MYFICSSLAYQAMFRVVSNWLYSLSVVFRRDTNTKVLVLSKPFPTKSGRIVFFFADQELLQHRVHGIGSFRELAIQQVIYIGRHHGNDVRFLASKREQNRQNLIQGKLNCFCTRSSIEATILVLHLLHHRWEHANAKIAPPAIPSSGIPSAGIQYSKIRSISCP